MGCEPDYSSCSLRELLDVSAHIDRERYPERAKRVDCEIALRRKREAFADPAAGWAVAGQGAAPGRNNDAKGLPFAMDKGGDSELALAFKGSARDYFRIWIVNLCLSLMTLGIFSAWAKVRKKRFACSHTTLDGTPFQYLASPIPILKGRLIAGGGFLAYYISSHFFTSLVPWILGCGFILAPWVVARSAAFNARYTAFRNMTFTFKSGYFGAFKTLYVWGLVPIFMVVMFLDWDLKPFVLAGATLISALFFPWWMCRLKRFIVQNSAFGGQNGTFLATGGQYFGIYFVSGLIMLAFALPLAIAVAVLTATSSDPSDKLVMLSYISPLWGYTGYVFAYSYVKARSGNLVYNNMNLGPIRFQSTLRSMDLVKLYVTNAIGIVFSLGLLIPWAVIRTWKYRADHTRVWIGDDLTRFAGSAEGGVAAVGAEALDFFDVDISI